MTFCGGPRWSQSEGAVVADVEQMLLGPVTAGPGSAASSSSLLKVFMTTCCQTPSTTSRVGYRFNSNDSDFDSLF